MSDTWDYDLEYEQFLRLAFGLEQRKLISRYDDPAGVADADQFSPDNLEVVKVSVAYAMMVYRNTIRKQADIQQSDNTRFSNYVIKVVNAEYLANISDLITGFNESIVNRYFKIEDGCINLKNI